MKPKQSLNTFSLATMKVSFVANALEEPVKEPNRINKTARVVAGRDYTFVKYVNMSSVIFFFPSIF